MIYITLNVLFNAFLLAIVLLLGSGVTHIAPKITWGLAYAIAGSLGVPLEIM